MEIKVFKKGIEKHELVQIDMLDIPKNVRKIFGIALEKNHKRLFEQLGFKKETKSKLGTVYSRFFNNSKKHRKKK